MFIAGFGPEVLEKTQRPIAGADAPALDQESVGCAVGCAGHEVQLAVRAAGSE